MNRTIITVDWDSHTDFREALERLSLSNLTKGEYGSSQFKCKFETTHCIDNENLIRLNIKDDLKNYAKELGIYGKNSSGIKPKVRACFWFYLFNHKGKLDLTLTDIGEITGGHSHSTVLNAIKKMISNTNEINVIFGESIKEKIKKIVNGN